MCETSKQERIYYFKRENGDNELMCLDCSGKLDKNEFNLQIVAKKEVDLQYKEWEKLIVQSDDFDQEIEDHQNNQLSHELHEIFQKYKAEKKKTKIE